jgi:DNA modification methylase
VMDPFAGSNTTGHAAELLSRRWVAIEKNESYLNGSKIRFEEAPNLFNPTPINGKTQKI